MWYDERTREPRCCVLCGMTFTPTEHEHPRLCSPCVAKAWTPRSPEPTTKGGPTSTRVGPAVSTVDLSGYTPSQRDGDSGSDTNAAPAEDESAR